MTFTEAAAQVLRLVGKPLHYKEITDVAIEKNLLSHVGKSPEVTMGARLAALVKKGDRDNPLIRVKPGVFALREWDKDTIEKGLADRTPALERLAQAFGDREVEVEEAPTDEEPAAASAPEASRAGYAEVDDDEARPPDEAELRRAEIAAGATDLFAPEDDDDQPIFGPESDEAEGKAANGDRDARRPRRRGRGRGRGRGGDEPRGDDLPTYTVSDAPIELGDAPTEPQGAVIVARDERVERDDQSERQRGDRPRDDRPRDDRPRDDRPRDDRGPRDDRPRDDRPRDDRSRDDRSRDDRSRDDRSRDDRSRDDRPRDDRPRNDQRNDARNDGRNDGRGDVRIGGPLEELAGRDLADALAVLLASYDRNRGPVGLQSLAEGAVRRGRLSDMQAGQQLLLAAARADNQRRSAQGLRPRFRVAGSRIGLTEWLMDAELVRLERDLLLTAERFREAARRLLLRRLQELPQRAIGELVVLVLERAGFSELSVVRRPGAHGAELHMSGKTTGPAGELRTAVVVRRDGREIGRERVTELRGALHHYGPANAGWLVTTGQVLSGAREEAGAPSAAPVTLVDGLGLAKLSEEHGIAVMQIRMTLPLPDVDLLDALRSG